MRGYTEKQKGMLILIYEYNTNTLFSSSHHFHSIFRNRSQGINVGYGPNNEGKG